MTKPYLQDKTIWITGASGGLGEAMARVFADYGAPRILLSARRENELQRVAADLKNRGCDAQILPLNLEQLDTLPDAVTQAENIFTAADGTQAGIDIMIHNAGLSQRSRIVETDFSVYERLMRLNYFAPVRLTQALLPGMLARGRGHFVPISSLSGLFGTPVRSAYSGSKFALNGYFETVRAELKPKGIEVTLVCPGFVRTDIANNALVGDGSPQGTMDQAQRNGLDPKYAAEKIACAVANQSRICLPAGREGLAYQVKRFVPDLFAWMIQRIRTT